MIRPTEIHQCLLQATEIKTRQDLPRFTETTLDAPRSVWTPRDPPTPAAILQDPMRPVKTCRNLLKHTATHWDLVKPPQDLPRPSMTRFSSGFWWSKSASMYLSKFFAFLQVSANLNDSCWLSAGLGGSWQILPGLSRSLGYWMVPNVTRRYQLVSYGIDWY